MRGRRRAHTQEPGNEAETINEVQESITTSAKTLIWSICSCTNSHGAPSCLPPPTSGGHGFQQDQSEVETPPPEWNQDTAQWLPW